MAMSAHEGVPSSPLSRLRLKAEDDGLIAEVLHGMTLDGDGSALPKLIPLEEIDLVHQAHQFSERANWLVPGKVLLGKYPGQIPADLPANPHRQIARDRVLDIVLRGGVTDLFCLQAELPPQDDEGRWNPPAEGEGDNGLFFSGFRAYRGDAVAAVTAAAAAAAPAHEGRAAERGDDETGILGGDKREQEGGGAGAEGRAEAGLGSRGREGLAFHHFPIPDLSPAENTEILAGLVDQLEALVASEKVPFIHCWAGRGRTGLIASCLLGRLYPELSAEQALNRVDKYYRTRGTVAIGKTCRVSPETEEQDQQVRLFFRQVLKR
ncbi:unnamed protein product [Scytosiphon promiscuus]